MNSMTYSLPGTFITPEFIVNVVADVYQIKPEIIYQPGRHRSICEPRMMCMFLIRNVIKFNMVQTGFIFNKDHATVCHSCKRIIEDTKYNKQTRKKFIESCSKLGLSGETINEYLKGL